MKTFTVTVRTLLQRTTYSALGYSSSAVHMHALNRFGGLCSVTVTPT